MGDWKRAGALEYELILGNTYDFLQGDTLNTGVSLQLTDMSGSGYNELTVTTYDQAPRFPLFEGRDPMLTAQRIVLDPAYFYFSGKLYLDVEIFDIENPDAITIYYRAANGNGTFIPANTTYNFVTGKLIADFAMESINKYEFVFGYNDFEASVYAPLPTLPEYDAVVYHSELQKLEWSPKGMFNYFALQIATDQDFNSIVYANDSLSDTYYNFECEMNTSYYWRVKTYLVDYVSTLESGWSDVFVFHSAEAQISVFEPASEAKWQYGLEYFIEWEDNFTNDVVLELLTDTTESVLDTTESDGAYLWSIPVDMEIGCRYRIRVSSLEDPSVSAISPYYFSITDTAGNDGCTFKIRENYTLTGINVFPNPASEMIHLEFVSQDQLHVYINLLDVHGRRVKEMFSGNLKTGANKYEFSTKGLIDGVYFLQIVTKTEHFTSKIIINR